MKVYGSYVQREKCQWESAITILCDLFMQPVLYSFSLETLKPEPEPDIAQAAAAASAPTTEADMSQLKLE